MIDEKAFGRRLKELRKLAGLTQHELAAKSGLGERTVSALEQGLYDATFSTVQALCTVLGVKCDAFQQAANDDGHQGRGRPAKVAIADRPTEEPASDVKDQPAPKKRGKKV